MTTNNHQLMIEECLALIEKQPDKADVLILALAKNAFGVSYIAEQLQISRSYYYRWMRQPDRLPFKIWVQLCKMLGLEVTIHIDDKHCTRL